MVGMTQGLAVVSLTISSSIIQSLDCLAPADAAIVKGVQAMCRTGVLKVS